MLTLCWMFSKTYYAQNYAGIIGLGLNTGVYTASYTGLDISEYI